MGWGKVSLPARMGPDCSNAKAGRRAGDEGASLPVMGGRRDAADRRSAMCADATD